MQNIVSTSTGIVKLKKHLQKDHMFQSQLYWDRETKKYILSINITSNWVNQAIQNIVSCHIRIMKTKTICRLLNPNGSEYVQVFLSFVDHLYCRWKSNYQDGEVWDHNNLFNLAPFFCLVRSQNLNFRRHVVFYFCSTI